MGNLTKFEDLDIPALTLVAQEQYEECLWAIEKALAKQLEFGRVMLIVKSKLPYGEWGNWVRETFQDHLSLRTIQTHMKAHDAVAQNPALLECANSLDDILTLTAKPRKPSVEVIEVVPEIVAADMPAVEVITAMATVKPAKKRAAAEPDVISKTFATLSPQKKMAELRKLSADPDVMRIRSEKQKQEMSKAYQESAIEGASNFITQAANELHKYQTNFGADFRWLPGAMKTTEGFAEVLYIIRRLDQIAIDAAAYSKTLNEKTRGNRGDD